HSPGILPALQVRYEDFAAWQADWWNKGGGSDHLRYWCDHLAGAPTTLELATDHPRRASQSFRGKCERLRLEPDLCLKFREMARREGASLFMSLAAVYSVLLHRYTGQDELLLGTPVTRRDRLELESMVGLFVNTLIQRANLTGNPTFRELLKRVREEVINSLVHQSVPLEKLVEELHPERNARQTPLIQTMFVFQ